MKPDSHGEFQEQVRTRMRELISRAVETFVTKDREYRSSFLVSGVAAMLDGVKKKVDRVSALISEGADPSRVSKEVEDMIIYSAMVQVTSETDYIGALVPPAEVIAEEFNTCSRMSTCRYPRVAFAILKSGYVVRSANVSLLPEMCRSCDRKGEFKNTKSLSESCPSIHAEQRLITTACSADLSLRGASVFLANGPCWVCAKILSELPLKGLHIGVGGWMTEATVRMLTGKFECFEFECKVLDESPRE